MTSIFDLARKNEFEQVEALILDDFSLHTSSTLPHSQYHVPIINTRDDYGRTALHICASYGCEETAQKLIALGADMTFQDYESGWTPLHRSLYFGHLRISLLLIKAGCDIGEDLRYSDWRLRVQPKKESNRSIRNNSSWLSPIDNDGYSPLDLLSFRLSPYLSQAKNTLESTSVQGFGVADYQLGIQLGNTSWHSIRPRRIDSLNTSHVISLAAGKYHSLAITNDGRVFSWGHGRGGRLGHGDEITQPEPRQIEGAIANYQIISVSAGENHTLALSSKGDVLSWGSNRFGQLGHGGKIDIIDQDNSGTGSNISGFSSYCLAPKKIDSFKRKKIICIAAAASHSLCATEKGEVFAWGSNKHGQLGVRQYDTTSLQNGSGQGVSKPKLVDIKCQSSSSTLIAHSQTPLSFSSPNAHNLSRNSSNNSSGNFKNDGKNGSTGYKVIQISAGPFSSLALLSSNTFLSGNKTEIWQWGHGSDLPSKVQFQRTSSAGAAAATMSSLEFAFHQSGGYHNKVKMTQVSAGRYHNCALSSAGHVYSWGLGSDQLGQINRDFSPNNNMFNSSSGSNSHGNNNNLSRSSIPQLVESLLPENGGGKVAYIAVCDHHTCALTDTGDLYTWGLASDKSGDGAAQSSSQRVPKRVVGIKRAVQVAAGEDHTLILIAASIPDLPHSEMYEEGVISARTIDDGRRRRSNSEYSSIDEEREKVNDETYGHNKSRLSSGKKSLSVSKNNKRDIGRRNGLRGQLLFESDSSSETSESSSNASSHQIDNPELEDYDDEDRAVSSEYNENGEFELENADFTHGMNPYANSPDEYSPLYSSNSLIINKVRKEGSIDFSSSSSNSKLSVTVPSLKQFCERKLAEQVDIVNAPSLLAIAKMNDASALVVYCSTFILRNLDALLVQCKQSDLDILISDIMHSVTMREGLMLTERERENIRRSHSISSVNSLDDDAFVNDESASCKQRKDSVDAAPYGTKGRGRSGSRDLYTIEGVQRAIKNTKKKLTSIDQLEEKMNTGLTPLLQAEQLEKLHRRAVLLSELKRLTLISSRLIDDERKHNMLREKEIECNNEDLLALSKDKVDNNNNNNNNDVALADQDKELVTENTTSIINISSSLRDKNEAVLGSISTTKSQKKNKKLQTFSLTAFNTATTLSKQTDSAAKGAPPLSFTDWVNLTTTTSRDSIINAFSNDYTASSASAASAKKPAWGLQKIAGSPSDCTDNVKNIDFTSSSISRSSSSGNSSSSNISNIGVNSDAKKVAVSFRSVQQEQAQQVLLAQTMKSSNGGKSISKSNSPTTILPVSGAVGPSVLEPINAIIKFNDKKDEIIVSTPQAIKLQPSKKKKKDITKNKDDNAVLAANANNFSIVTNNNNNININNDIFIASSDKIHEKVESSHDIIGTGRKVKKANANAIMTSSVTKPSEVVIKNSDDNCSNNYGTKDIKNTTKKEKSRKSIKIMKVNSGPAPQLVSSPEKSSSPISSSSSSSSSPCSNSSSTLLISASSSVITNNAIPMAATNVSKRNKKERLSLVEFNQLTSSSSSGSSKIGSSSIIAKANRSSSEGSSASSCPWAQASDNATTIICAAVNRNNDNNIGISNNDCAAIASSNLIKAIDVSKKKSFLEIQQQEEQDRINSCSISSNNNKLTGLISNSNETIPWYIERRPRAESLERVMSAQEEEKRRLQIEKEKLEHAEIQKKTKEAVMKEEKEKEKEKKLKMKLKRIEKEKMKKQSVDEKISSECGKKENSPKKKPKTIKSDNSAPNTTTITANDDDNNNNNNDNRSSSSSINNSLNIKKTVSSKKNEKRNDGSKSEPIINFTSIITASNNNDDSDNNDKKSINNSSNNDFVHNINETDAVDNNIISNVIISSKTEAVSKPQNG